MDILNKKITYIAMAYRRKTFQFYFFARSPTPHGTVTSLSRSSSCAHSRFFLFPAWAIGGLGAGTSYRRHAPTDQRK
jgi:hypothetical protein